MISKNSQPLLIIEDSDEDFEASYRIIQQQAIINPIFRCIDGEEALDFLYHQGDYSDIEKFPRPALILLDINLPGTDGIEVLIQIKHDQQLNTIPVVIFTTSSNLNDIEVCYRNYASSYILKPIDIKKLVKTIQSLITYWLDTVILPDHLSR
jgi:CheY-like chemotaxis protein